MLTERFCSLLAAAADALEDGRDPFSLDFLGEHEITATEYIDLSTTMSIILNGYLSAPNWIQKGILICGAIFSNGDIRVAKDMWPHYTERYSKTLKRELSI